MDTQGTLTPPPGISTAEASARQVVADALAKRVAYLAAKAEAEATEADWRVAEAEACEAMDLAEKSSLHFDGIGLAVRSVSHHLSVTDREVLLEALDAEGLKEELTFSEVRRAALREKVLAKVKAGEGFWPGIEYYARPTLAVRRSK